MMSIEQCDQWQDFSLEILISANLTDWSMIYWQLFSDVLDDFNSSAAVWNLTLNHIKLIMFKWNYLSRIIHYSTQDVFWQCISDHDSVRVTSWIDCLRDSNWSTKLIEKQSQQIWQSFKVLELAAIHDNLHAKIVTEFDVIKIIKKESVYKNYETLKWMLNSIIWVKEQTLWKQIQKKYDATASVIIIQW